MDKILDIHNLSLLIEDKEVLRSFSLSIGRGEMHVLLGPNGVGKSTLSKVLFSHPTYTAYEGSIYFCGEDIGRQSPDQCAQKGLFLGFQQPPEIPGISVEKYLKALCSLTKKIPLKERKAFLENLLNQFGFDRSLFARNVNEGFSGGEKKRFEMMQLSILQPKCVVLDEIDSGVDIDNRKVITEALLNMRDKERSFLIISHNLEVVRQLSPDYIHVMKEGSIVQSGDNSILSGIEEKGFQE